MSEQVLHLWSRDDIGEVLNRAGATQEIERGSKALMRQFPDRFPDTAEGQSDAVKLYCQYHPATATIYAGYHPQPVIMEAAE